MSSVTIPASLDEAIDALSGIERLLTAKGWERAAVVYAFTDPGTGGPRTGREVARLSIRAFAELGIAGLTTKDSVRRYRTAWEQYGELGIKPGDEVTLPDVPFPPDERSKGRTEDATIPTLVRKLTEREDLGDVVSALLDNPMVEDTVVTAVSKHVGSVTRESNPTPVGDGGMAAMTSTVKMHNALRTIVREAQHVTPDERAHLDELIGHLEQVINLLRSLTEDGYFDKQLAELLGDI